MFYPETLPDEFQEGYYGRLIRINGVPEKAPFLLAALRQLLPADEFPTDSPGQIEILAYAANMTLPEFVRKHTLLPYRRAITSYEPDLVHGDESRRSMIQWGAGRTARPGAYLCSICVEDDLKNFGMSYWRRVHQIPGMYVCPEHSHALQYTEKNDAFLSAPSTFVDHSFVMDKQWAFAHDGHPAVRRFLNLSMVLALGEKPVEVRKIRNPLVQQAQKRGLGLSQSGPELLSDRITSTFPGPWLETLFPGITTKPIGENIDQIDGVLYLSTASSSVAAYLLALSVLYDSEEDALAALRDAGTVELNRRRRKTKEDVVSADVDFTAEYVRTKGNHSRVAKENGIALHTVINGLRGSGLPNLSTNGKQKERLLHAAANFFIHRQPLVQSAESAGVDQEDLERVVRHAGANLHAALKKMMPRKGGNTRATAPLGTNQLPHLLGHLD